MCESHGGPWYAFASKIRSLYIVLTPYTSVSHSRLRVISHFTCFLLRRPGEWSHRHTSDPPRFKARALTMVSLHQRSFSILSHICEDSLVFAHLSDIYAVCGDHRSATLLTHATTTASAASCDEPIGLDMFDAAVIYMPDHDSALSRAKSPGKPPRTARVSRHEAEGVSGVATRAVRVRGLARRVGEHGT